MNLWILFYFQWFRFQATDFCCCCWWSFKFKQSKTDAYTNMRIQSGIWVSVALACGGHSRPSLKGGLVWGGLGGGVRGITRKHGEPWFSRTLVIGDPQENGEQSEEKIDLFMFFFVFSGWGFWKIIRAGLPHFWTGLELWRPKFDRFRTTFPFFFSLLIPKSMKI